MKFLFLIFSIPIIFLIIMLGLSIFLSPNDMAGCSNRPNRDVVSCHAADVIVAISGGDTRLRTEKAIGLYKNGWAEHIIFAGDSADPNSPSNAEEMRNIALNAGVPDEAILLDKVSRNTRENAKNVAEILQENGWTDIILVSQNYHLRRARMHFALAAPDARIRTIAAQPDNFWWATPRGWIRVVTELGGVIRIWLSGAIG